MLFEKINMVFGFGAIILYAQYILHRWRPMVAFGELLVLFTATQLKK